MSNPQSRNALLSIASDTSWGALMGLTASATVMAVLLEELGASRTTIGLIVAMEMFGIVLGQPLAPLLFHRRETMQSILVIWYYAIVTPPLLLIAVALVAASFMTHQAIIICILVLYFLFCFTNGMGMPSVLDWFASIFPQGQRGPVMGVGWAGAAIFASIAGVVAGWLIEHSEQFLGYAWIIWLAAAIGFLATLFYQMMVDPVALPLKKVEFFNPTILWNDYCKSLSNPKYQPLLIARALHYAAFCAPAFIAVHFSSVSGGSLDGATIVYCGVAMTLGNALGNLLAGLLGDKHGHILGVFIGLLSHTLLSACLLFATGIWACVLVYALAGLGLGSFVSYTNLMYETCPEGHNRTAHIVVGNVAAGLVGGFCSLAAAWAAGWLPLHMIFSVTLGMGVIGLLWVLRMIRQSGYHSSAVNT